MVRYFRFAVLILACILSACGFALRGYHTVPEIYRSMYIQNEDLSLNQLLHSKLKKHGAILTDSPQQAKVILRIIGTNNSQSEASVSANSNTRVYNLNYELTFELLNNNAQTLIMPKRIYVHKSLTINNNQLLGSNFEAKALKIAMQREAVARLISQLK